MFLMKKCSFSITKSKNVGNLAFFAQGKLDTAVGSQKPHMTQFVSSQLIGFFLLNLCFVSMSSSLYLLKSFSERHFLSKSMTNFSSQEKILFKEYFSFFANTAVA